MARVILADETAMEVNGAYQQELSNEPVEQQYTLNRWWSSFVAGGVALSLAFSVTHPLDTLKTQMQASVSRRIVPWRELFTKLSHGVAASALAAGPQGAIRLSTYEWVKWRLGDSGIGGVTVAAVAGDVASSIVKVPREIVVSRLQTQGGTAMLVARQILRHEGPRGLFRGFMSTTARDCPFMVCLFGGYELSRPYHHYHGQLGILAGGACGAGAAFVTTPLDCIKTRIMTNASESGGMARVAHQILRERGVGGFFVGAVPRSVWWFTVCSIFFPTYEAVKSSLLLQDGVSIKNKVVVS